MGAGGGPSPEFLVVLRTAKSAGYTRCVSDCNNKGSKEDITSRSF